MISNPPLSDLAALEAESIYIIREVVGEFGLAEPGSGPWSHAGGAAEPPMSLRDIAHAGGRMTYPSHRRTEPESRLAEYLAEARRILADPPPPTSSPEHITVDDDFETLRWFPLSDEVAVRS